ncbi:hypothetical protein VF14_14310 [Nostoc linckia z18]|jgi:hypothetical protein|uniref:Uncharacterized protein n=2 Tax=Nostoc linckia TaxID=92942 RepID=A0A9Q5ZCR3_NOSLI|nr:hypothetical protein [Nostoc linckia]PHJ75201.1 hypothetical protein VF03_11080 [Nostoc linckia z2]PHJ79192.1 hypothetical protein VF06_26475 [Nostoc linckia z4]PHJ84079.1 hypothetical protein VF07_25665 [Nostoc linckia z6]PHJ94276.1 hypothetical protein VF04_22865 [Nostoc linckia z7]PHK03897.1 hypothetical protein VF08_13480 [Nostoc linckia z8]PHK08918.1 hypothetical protein VF09_17925 [Nostoc linckia z9]PHK41010.1 hypothetical protein VF12_08140 [Nostoc linckia z15]PHK45703.1 hypotheti
MFYRLSVKEKLWKKHFTRIAGHDIKSKAAVRLKFCFFSCQFQAVNKIVDNIVAIGSETGKISILAHLAFCAIIFTPTPGKPANLLLF